MTRQRFAKLLAISCVAIAACNGAERSSTHDPVAEPTIGQPATLDRLVPLAPEGHDTGFDKAAGDTLCQPCTSSQSCGGTPNYCLRRSDGVQFCGQDCRSAPCPTGYSCTRLSSSVSQCVPPQADCSRVPRDAGAPDAGADAGAADAGTASDGGAMSDAGAIDAGSVPGSAHCAPAANWNPTWAAYEDEVLRLSNQYRGSGASCGSVRYGPAAALTMSPALRCAARLHSKDMQDRNYFDHTTPDGVTFDRRITASGYDDWRTIGENIAAGQRTPQQVVQAWMQSVGHCQNVMNPNFKELGVGFYDSYRWTQDFGARF